MIMKDLIILLAEAQSVFVTTQHPLIVKFAHQSKNRR